MSSIDRIGLTAIALAGVGVAIQAMALGHFPFVSLILAVSFCGYGIVRKRVAADAQTGLLVECLILSLPGLAYVLWLERSGAGHFGADLPTTLWLLACGPITATPLMLFAWAARRIPLSFMGFLQFMAPDHRLLHRHRPGRGVHAGAGRLLRLHLVRRGGVRLRRLEALAGGAAGRGRRGRRLAAVIARRRPPRSAVSAADRPSARSPCRFIT